MVFSIILLCLIGAALGGGAAFLYLWAIKRLTKKNTSAPSGTPRVQKREDAATRKQLLQLRGQLDSGLLTKEEFTAKKREILKNQ